MDIRNSTLDGVKSVVVATLGIEDRADTLDVSTALFGSMPELDSLAVVELIAAIEERFGFEIDESDVTGDVFDTIGSLAAFVDENLG